MKVDDFITVGFDPAEIEKLAQSLYKMDEEIRKIAYVTPQPYVPRQAVIKSTDPNLEALLVEVNRRIDAAYEEGYAKGHSDGQKDWDKAPDWERELLRTWDDE